MGIRPTTTLRECAEALLRIKITDEELDIRILIDDAYEHLRELESAHRCNPTLVSALAHRINRAESILERKIKARAQSEAERGL